MFDKLGIVTNCLTKRMANKDAFEKLIGDFIRNGFLHIEIRDGDYLRQSGFGKILQEVETAIQDAIQIREDLLTYQKKKGATP